MRKMISEQERNQIIENKNDIAQINAVTQYLRYNDTESKLQVWYPASVEKFIFVEVPVRYGNKKLCTFTSNVVKSAGWSIEDDFPATIGSNELWYYEDYQIMVYYDGTHKWVGASPIQGVGTVTDDGALYPGYTHISGEWKNIAVE